MIVLHHIFMLFDLSFLRENILKLKDEFYKPRDLAENEELENIIDAILKQKAMAMDTGYVADVSNILDIFIRNVNSFLWTINRYIVADC